MKRYTSIKPKEVAILAIIAQNPERPSNIKVVSNLTGIAKVVGLAIIDSRNSPAWSVAIAQDIRRWCLRNKKSYLNEKTIVNNSASS